MSPDYRDVVAYLRGQQSIQIDPDNDIVSAILRDKYYPVTNPLIMDGMQFQLAQANLTSYRLYYCDVGSHAVFFEPV